MVINSIQFKSNKMRDLERLLDGKNARSIMNII